MAEIKEKGENRSEKSRGNGEEEFDKGAKIGKVKRKSRDRKRSDSLDDSSSRENRDKKNKKRQQRKQKSSRHYSSSDESDNDRRRQRRRKHSSRRKKSRSNRKRKKRRRRHYSSSENSSSDTDSSSSSSSNSDDSREATKKSSKVKKILNTRLLEKLSARGETLEEREERRAQRRAARIEAKFGYTSTDNPFHDPNLHETFVWKKREDPKNSQNDNREAISRGDAQEKTFHEIAKVRQRRKDREMQMEEMDRIKAEEARMKELENYDEWAAKEEEFHLQQQRQRSAIRLVEGRERPVDVLAKNLLLFGLTEEEKQNRAAVKYKEKYNAIDELETLEAELEEPHLFLSDLKLVELQELRTDIHSFCVLEREAAAANSYDESNTANQMVLQYWSALNVVVDDEISFLQGNGKDKNLLQEIQELFKEQSKKDLEKMKIDIEMKLQKGNNSQVQFDHNHEVVDVNYWEKVLGQLKVHLAKMELSDIHSKMLVCQLEKLEKRKEALSKASGDNNATEFSTEDDAQNANNVSAPIIPQGIDPNLGNLDEELGISDEVKLLPVTHTWQEKYQPRKPRYFNRVKTGYDWNKYNQTHYDHDNPPPKIVQGYKFNVFYPDLIDKSTTPSYRLEAVPESDEFCIIRFTAGPPYEDLAFKIINRSWNKSRKRGFRCTFERGVLSLYFNFASHWYRR